MLFKNYAWKCCNSLTRFLLTPISGAGFHKNMYNSLVSNYYTIIMSLVVQCLSSSSWMVRQFKVNFCSNFLPMFSDVFSVRINRNKRCLGDEGLVSNPTAQTFSKVCRVFSFNFWANVVPFTLYITLLPPWTWILIGWTFQNSISIDLSQI